MFFADLSLAFLLIAYPLAVGIPLYSRARVRDLPIGPFSNSTATSLGHTTSGAPETEVHPSSASESSSKTHIESQVPLAPPMLSIATEIGKPQATPSASPIEISLLPSSATITYSDPDSEHEIIGSTHVLPSRESDTFADSPSRLSEDDATPALPYMETGTVSASIDTSNGIESTSNLHPVGSDAPPEALPEGSRVSDGFSELEKTFIAGESTSPDQPRLPSTGLEVTSKIEMLPSADPAPAPGGPRTSSEVIAESSIDTFESTAFERLSSSVGPAEGASQTDGPCPQATPYCTPLTNSDTFKSAAASFSEAQFQVQPTSYTQAMHPVQNLELASNGLQTDFSQESLHTGTLPTKNVVYYMTVERQTMGPSFSPASVSHPSASALSADVSKSIADSFVSTKTVDDAKPLFGYDSSQARTEGPSSRVGSTFSRHSSHEGWPGTSSPVDSTLPIPTKVPDSTEQGDNQAKSSSKAKQSGSPEYDALAPSRGGALSPRQQGTTAGIIIASAGAASAVGICIFLGARKFRNDHGGSSNKVSTSRSTRSSMDIQCVGLGVPHALGLSTPYHKIS